MWNPFHSINFQILEALLTLINRQEKILANLADLQAAIDAAPAAITTQVVDAVKPLIQPTVDTQPQIDAINALPATVAQQVTAALQTPPTP